MVRLVGECKRVERFEECCVTATLLHMVVSSQDMMRVACDGNKQLVICGSSQGLSCREVIRRVAAAPQSSQYPLQTRPVLHRSEAPPGRGGNCVCHKR